MNQSEIEAKRRNRRQARENLASKARLVLILLLIGWERGTYFAGQSQSEVKQNQLAKMKLLSTLSWNPL